MSVAVTNDYYGSGRGTNDDYVGKFIPEVWSGKLAVKFYLATTLTEITNNDWEGEIKDVGDRVHIRSIPDVTIKDYTKGMTLALEVPKTTVIDLIVDKGKYFAVVVDDVDKVQSDIKLMDNFTTDAATQMKIAVETTVYTTAYSSAAAGNYGNTAGKISGTIVLGAVGAPLQITKTNVLDWIVDMGLCLDEQNVPEVGRWLLLPPWVAALIKKSDLKNTYMTGDDTSPLRNGRLGEIDRFTLYVTNNLHRVTDLGADSASGGVSANADAVCWNVMAGTRDAISFASQIAKTEALRSTTTFGNIVRGLNVYGFKVTKPEALIWSRIKQ